MSIEPSRNNYGYFQDRIAGIIQVGRDPLKNLNFNPIIHSELSLDGQLGSFFGISMAAAAAAAACNISATHMCW
jgi:hypothetical protein